MEFLIRDIPREIISGKGSLSKVKVYNFFIWQTAGLTGSLSEKYDTGLS